jgi:hypothetical protein
VRVETVVPVRYLTEDGQEKTCGHRFAFSVVEELKPNRDVENWFFSESETGYSGKHLDYLIFVFERGGGDIDSVIASLRTSGGRELDESEKRRLRCVMSERQFVLSTPITMIPIEALEEAGPVEWLRLRAPAVVPVDEINEGDRHRSAPLAEPLVRWSAAATLIHQALERQ